MRSDIAYPAFGHDIDRRGPLSLKEDGFAAGEFTITGRLKDLDRNAFGGGCKQQRLARKDQVFFLHRSILFSLGDKTRNFGGHMPATDGKQLTQAGYRQFLGTIAPLGLEKPGRASNHKRYGVPACHDPRKAGRPMPVASNPPSTAMF